jgi:hypothetical protein
MEREFFTEGGLYFFAEVLETFTGFNGSEHMRIRTKSGGEMWARPSMGHMQAHTKESYDRLSANYERLVEDMSNCRRG